jgi:hypothetical protein
LLAVHQGGIRPDQLDYYLAELTFRFNRRLARKNQDLVVTATKGIAPWLHLEFVKSIPARARQG